MGLTASSRPVRQRHSWLLEALAGEAGALVGGGGWLVNGAFQSLCGLPSFVVTLGMLAAARSSRGAV